MTNLMQLNDQFGIDNSVVFKEDPEGNVRVEILNSYATASIMMQGAHLISWVPKDEQPVIWLSREAKFGSVQAEE